ncbi:hypothetical protein K0817_014295 [Microbacterium sp. HD4P20]|uniref:hypothetical protein n=1 Tax=Microbacterium sp. HD4P20 TaxID=2864874 RepID=UPI001C641EC7|nr:hypothetical protein [Microbacterium sp. HD4P20]MCP2637724.1 hypothetical protein [Microbacterium sp. HD4P20]
MYNDYGGLVAGYGLIFILGIVIYLGSIALVLWIGYLIMRAAVKNGILAADKARREQGGQFPGGYPPAPPMQPHGPPAR